MGVCLNAVHHDVLDNDDIKNPKLFSTSEGNTLSRIVLGDNHARSNSLSLKRSDVLSNLTNAGMRHIPLWAVIGREARA